ncbi:MAG TPA: NAD(P)H-dependent oxidoreductase subunit E [Actinomycetes bacterium]
MTREPQQPLASVVRSALTPVVHEPGPLLLALHAVQQALGHVPDDAVPVIADELNLSRADIHGVVTFYRDFRRTPAGRTQVRVCRAEACQAVGGQALLDGVTQRLGVGVGETSVDGAVTVEEVFCLGNCALGPSALVDGRLHGRLTVDRLVGLLPSVPTAEESQR